jgi:hypothetical protein
MQFYDKVLIKEACIIFFTIYVWLQTAYGLLIGFIDHIYIPLRTTSNYSAIAISTAPAKPFSSLLHLHMPFPSKWLLTVEILPLSVLRSYLHSILCRTQHSTDYSQLMANSHQPHSLLFTAWLSAGNWQLTFLFYLFIYCKFTIYSIVYNKSNK